TGSRREAANCWRQEEQARHSTGWGCQPTACQYLHEPLPQALASIRTWRGLPCSRRCLCRRLRHPQLRSRGRGSGVDEGGDDQARADDQREQNLAEGCPAGALRLPWILIRPTLPVQVQTGRPTAHECESLEEERATAQGQSARAAGAEQRRSLARSAGRLEPFTTG